MTKYYDIHVQYGDEGEIAGYSVFVSGEFADGDEAAKHALAYGMFEDDADYRLIDNVTEIDEAEYDRATK